MERITGRVGYALAYVGESRKDPQGDVPGEMSVQAVMDVLGRLEQYENTGLEPGKIAGRIDRRDAMDLAEISGILAAIAAQHGMGKVGMLATRGARKIAEILQRIAGGDEA